MPRTECRVCGGDYHWQWEDAFDKFGFDDGDGQVMTQTVVIALEKAGYVVSSWHSGIHNEIVIGIAKDGVSLISNRTNCGYDDPRAYLPREIINLLDRAFPQEEALP